MGDPLEESLRAVEQLPPVAPDDSEASDVLLDAADFDTEGIEDSEPCVIDGLQRERAILTIAGEEGDGKTMLAEQLCRQLLRNESILGFWTPGELRPERVLFVDTHQADTEVRPRWREMAERGLEVERGCLRWWCSGALTLSTDPADRDRLEAMIRESGATYLWLDAGSHLVEDPKDDVEVSALFDYLAKMQRALGLVGLGLTLFPRKQAQNTYGRSFDDTFGSREWKGRPSVALYIDTKSVRAFKDRPGFLRRSWPLGRNGGRYRTAVLLRPGLSDPTVPPFTIATEGVEDAGELNVEAVREQALDKVREQPEHFTKTSLAGALGVRVADALVIVGVLITEGTLGPDKPRARLRVIGENAQASLA